MVAVSDWMRAVPDLIAPYAPHGLQSLGTDGFGLSDTRPALRRHFHVDAESIVVRTLASLADWGQIDRAASGRPWRSTRSATCRPPRRRSGPHPR